MEGKAESNLDGAMDAINEALGITDAIEDEEDLENGDADGDSDADTEEDGEGDDSADGEGEGDEEGDADGDADEEGEPSAAAKAAAKAAGKPVSEFNADGTPKQAAKKPPDPINDPIPKDLKQDTRDRMQALVKIAKEKDAEITQVRGDFDTIINGIKASGSTPEQYGETISWLSLFNSPNADDRKKAYELVENVAERMATLLGIDRAAPDPFRNHPDIKAALTAGKITPELARETARMRDANQFKGQLETGRQTEQQKQQQAQAEYNQAKVDLNTFDTEMREKDPLYDLKRKQIVPILQPIFKQIPKSQWAQAYKDAYARARVKPQGKTAAPKNQPLRGGKQPAGGQSRAAGSALEAMNGALASLTK